MPATCGLPPKFVGKEKQNQQVVLHKNSLCFMLLIIFYYSNPRTITVMGDFSFITGYEPGTDINHYVEIGKPIMEKYLNNHSLDEAIGIDFIMEPGQKFNIEGALKIEKEKDCYKIRGIGECNPHWTIRGKYISMDYNLKIRAEILNQWLEIPPKLDLKYFNKESREIKPTLANNFKIDPFNPDDFPDKIIFIKITNHAGCNCVGSLNYKLSVEFTLTGSCNGPIANGRNWLKEREIGIPDLIHDIIVGNRFVKSMEIAIDKLKQIAENGTKEDKRIAGGMLDDLGTIAKSAGLKKHASALYNSSYRIFISIGANDLAEHVKNELKNL